jgi:diguanylate cyclase (GGDEF)-like protein
MKSTAARRIVPLNNTRQAAFLDDLAITLSSTADPPLCLLLVQLRGLSDLNHAFGYRAVDAILADFAARLAEGFSTRSKVVRIGPARFAIVLGSLPSEGHALLAANKVQRIAEAPFDTKGGRLKLDVAQGIALFPQHAAGAEDLLRRAEEALESAKQRTNAVVLYNSLSLSGQTELHRIDVELVHALEHGHLEVVFQPQMDLRLGRRTGAEALVRCRDRQGAPISPELLVQAAERTGRLRDMTAAIFTTAMRYAAEWHERDFALSLNASAHSFKDAEFVPSLISALKIWNRTPDALTIEITESVFLDEPKKSFATMRRLRDLGVRVSIDDFGIGYSSLSYFRDIPANELKVDKSFVLGMLEHAADREIVRAVINLAHAFGLEVVAEGVEDDATLATLRAMNCDKVQGFLIGRPMTPSAFGEWASAVRDCGNAPRAVN